MFERNRVDNASNAIHQTAIPAELVLADGEVLISSARAISEVLNGENLFLEFEPFESVRRYISKQAIRSVKIMDAPAANGLDARRPLNGEFDPYAALGLKRDAEWDDIRQAYLRLAKAYHADRYASIDLPGEVREYLQQMSRRVNAAYTLLEAPRLVVKKADMRPAPVYTSRPRV
jgi:DnaJ domain